MCIPLLLHKCIPCYIRIVPTVLIVWRLLCMQFRKMGYEMVDRICDYYADVEQQKVTPSGLQVWHQKVIRPCLHAWTC